VQLVEVVIGIYDTLKQPKFHKMNCFYLIHKKWN